MKKVSLLLITAMIGLFTGCASYQASALSSLNPEYVRTYDQIEGISIGCKAFTVQDCYDYLDRNVLAEGYQPIQLTFYNQSDRTYIFTRKGVSLISANPEEVARTVHTSTAGRVTGYTLGGVLLFPLTSPLFIPAIVDGIKSSNANASLDADFSEKGKSQLEIRPKSFSNALIFIPKAHYTPFFELSLVDKETGKTKVLDVTANQ
ncbi:MAG: hypothetical protein H7A41_06710 [Chlamydiales bacterium]|nr:hypothetical protein [Chlamydiales bacterium]